MLLYIFSNYIHFLYYVVNKAINQFMGNGCVNFSTNIHLEENVTISATLTLVFAGESDVVIQPNTTTILTAGLYIALHVLIMH